MIENLSIYAIFLSPTAIKGLTLPKRLGKRLRENEFSMLCYRIWEYGVEGMVIVAPSHFG